MNFTYYIPTKILFGRGQLSNLHKEKLPGKKALIVTTNGRSVIDNGYLARTEEELTAAGVSYVIYNKITANPDRKEVMEGAALAKKEGCDFVLGLGGGSPIDASKAIAIMATNEGDYWDYMMRGTGKRQKITQKPLPIVAITTTAGTGTEADPWTVISNEETEEKFGFGIDETFPVLAVVDPELMLSVPKNYTIYQGFDALFHSLEGYLANIATPISDIFALKAISLIAKNLPLAVFDGNDMDARENMALANTLSGMVESTSGCISEHALEHVLSGAHKNLPHGAGLIMLSVAYFSKIAEKHSSDERLVEMAKAMGKKDAKTPEDFIEALKDLQKACGADNLKMSDYGIEKSRLKEFAEAAKTQNAVSFLLDPCDLSVKDCLDIYEKSYK